MKNAQQPINPVYGKDGVTFKLDEHADYFLKDRANGLTKREYMATQILAGINANRWSMENGFHTYDQLAEIAVKQTDALLEALSKP